MTSTNGKNGFIHPRELVGFSRVSPTALSKDLRDLIAAIPDVAHVGRPPGYKRPLSGFCESNCLMILDHAAANNGPDLVICYGVVLLPANSDVPSPLRWRTHAWLGLDKLRFDPTYELAERRPVERCEYWEREKHRYADIDNQVRIDLRKGERQNFKLRSVRQAARDGGVDAILDFDLSDDGS